MSAANFGASLALTLIYEGGFSDNPADPGGATMCGITQRVYDEDRDARRLPRQPVRLSTSAERATLYRTRYWEPCGGDTLPAGVDYATFDFAVNSGVRRAVRALQGIVGVDADGEAGPQTLASVQHYCIQYGPTALTDALCAQRMHYLQGLATFATFGAGWRRRVMGAIDDPQTMDTGVVDRAYVMARGAPPKPPLMPTPTPKTYLARAA